MSRQKTSHQFLYTSSAKASLFDIVAEDSLRSSLKPAWGYLCKVLYAKHPEYLSKLHQYSDEVFYTLLFLLEEYSLRKKSASITESFYELTRESSAPQYSFRLRKVRWLSLCSLVVLPYISDKLEKYYDRLKEKIVTHDPSVTSFERSFCKFYPIIMTINKWIRIANYIMYLFNYTNHAFPLLHILRIQLKYAEMKIPIATLGTSGSAFNIFRRISDVFSGMVSKATPFMLYSLQFMETFYQDDVWSPKTFSNLTVAEPPLAPKVVPTEKKLPPSKKLCPLCYKEHVNPATTPISGFVFCYSCLYKYLEKFGCCPVTYRPCSVKDMIRLRP